MSVYRLEVERGDTFWVTAHDEKGALDIAAAFVADKTAVDEDALVQLTRDADDAVVFRAVAGRWAAAEGTI